MKRSEFSERQQSRQIARLLLPDFFSIMKLYRDKEKYESSIKKEIFAKIIEGTCNTEGKMEAILVKITSEKELNYTELEILGRFRQAYQTLRQHIRKRRNNRVGQQRKSRIFNI